MASFLNDPWINNKLLHVHCKKNDKQAIYTHQKSFEPLTLISLYFKLPIPMKSGKMIWLSSNFQRMSYVPITVDSVKDRYFQEMKLVLFKNNIFYTKMQNNHIYVF